MKKWLIVFLLSVSFLVGLASCLEAKSNLEAANEDLAVIEAIGKIPNPELQNRAIREFLEHIRSAIKQAVKNSDLRKFAWYVGDSRWCIIYEKKKHDIVASAWICKGAPPKDAKILHKEKEL